MATILSIFKSRCAKACFSLQKLEPEIARVYLPQCFDDKFLLALFVFHHMEDLKNKSSIRNTFFLFVWDPKSLKPSYLQQRQLWMKKFLAKTLGQIHPSDNSLKFLYKIKYLRTRSLQSYQNFDHCPTPNQLFQFSPYLL